MNEQANKILVDLLQKASNGIDTAVSFSQAQLPDIIQQLMVWRAAAYGLRIFTMLLFFIACVFLFKKSLKWHESYDKEHLGFFGIVFTVLIGLFLVFGILENIGNALQLWLAPKVWLIEYASELVK